jgi:hypothetical protein
MFLGDILLYCNNDSVPKLARESITYNAGYVYWREQLFERIMRLFVWENTYDVKKRFGVKPKEIEQRLLIAGHCGVTKINDERELTAMFGSFHGVSKYYDEKPEYTVRCPIYAGNRIIGKDVIVIDNCSLRNPALPLVHHYACMLAHTEVTLMDVLINARDCGGVPIVQTEKQKQSVSEYHSKLFNGQWGSVTDIGMLGIDYAGLDRGTRQDVMSILETREKLIKSFYSDIGVRSAFEKRNNTVMAEVEADTSLLLLNLSDMIDSRERGADEVNNLFNVNWSVHIAEEIDYSTENQRIQFDTATVIHSQPQVEGGGSNVESETQV